MPALEVKVELETCTQTDVLIWVLSGTHRLVKVVTIYTFRKESTSFWISQSTFIIQHLEV